MFEPEMIHKRTREQNKEEMYGDSDIIKIVEWGSLFLYSPAGIKTSQPSINQSNFMREPGTVACDSISSIQEPEAGGLLQARRSITAWAI